MPKAISKALFQTIVTLMTINELNDFSLGGGTNLALKYGYRISTDIDLFSNDIVGVNGINLIEKSLKNHFGHDIQTEILNKGIEHLCFLKAIINKNDVSIKLEIIQNIKLNYNFQKLENIRLIHDLDIGPLKLLSFANRGSKKDLYDLYFLSKKYGIETLYEKLEERHTSFPQAEKENQNIFNFPTYKPKENLESSVTALGNLNKAKDLKYSSNRVNLIEGGFFDNISFPFLCSEWIIMVKDLALTKKLKYKDTPNTRIYKKKRF